MLTKTECERIRAENNLGPGPWSKDMDSALTTIEELRGHLEWALGELDQLDIHNVLVTKRAAARKALE